MIKEAEEGIDYEILEQEPEQKQDSTEPDLKTRKRELWIALILSFGLDWITSLVSGGLSAVFPIAPIVIEEALENLFSNLVAKYGLKKDLGIWANVLGFIPIPGVTALTIGCIQELIKIYRKPTVK